MKIGAFQIRPVSLKLKRGLQTSRGVVLEREGFLIFCGEGVGEAMPLPQFGTESHLECAQALRRAQRDLEGHEVPSVSAIAELLSGIPSCARFGLETALLDGLAKEQGTSVARLLDPSATSSVSVNAVVDRGAEIPSGFASYKLKIQSADDVAWARDVRSVLGPACEIRLDANGTWSLETAASVLRQLEEIRPFYCEDPVAEPNDVPALRTHTSIRVAADGWLTTESAREAVLNERWAEVVVLKPAVLGGLIPALRLARRAKEKRMGAVVTTMLEGVVARQAALHLACAMQSPLAHGLSTGALLAQDYADDVAPVQAGRMALSQRSGLGVEVRA